MLKQTLIGDFLPNGVVFRTDHDRTISRAAVIRVGGVGRHGYYAHLLVAKDFRITTIQQILAGVGIESQNSALELVSRPALIFFEEVTDALEDMIRRVSRNGIERVLAIGLRRAALADGSAWRILASGASDVLVWDDPVKVAGSIAARLERWDAVDRMVDSPVVRENLVGRSPAWVLLLRQIVEIAHFTDASVLIVGESGTGKELLARLIHKLDTRPNKRELVLLDCTTIVPELSGTEFFGHERGAFTRDFYYRIASHICRVPTLRERTDDIIPLAQHFLKRFSSAEEPPGFDAPVREYLLSRGYPGNVRDLQRVVTRMSHRHVGRGPITMGDIPPEERSTLDSQLYNLHDPQFGSAISRAVSSGMGLRKIARRVIETAVDMAMQQESGNIKRAAKMLGITERALQMRRATSRRHAISS